MSNEIGMESKNIYLVDLSTQNAYHTANDYLQHYYPNDFNPIDYFYNGEKIIIELNDDDNRYYLYGDVDEYLYIRDFLGHSEISTTEIYARCDSEQKRKAIEAACPSITKADVPLWHSDSTLMEWLQSL